MLEAIRAHFPADYSRLTRAYHQARKRGDAGAAREAAFQTFNDLYELHGPRLAGGESGALYVWARAVKSLMDASAKVDPKLCAEAFHGDPRYHAGLDERMSGALATYMRATIEAYAASMKTRVAHADPTESDLGAFNGLVAGKNFSYRDLEAIGSPLAMKTRSYEDQCRLGRQLMSIVMTLPEPTKSRFLSDAAVGAM
ncbi:MAG: hypothetical protein K2Q06_06615 [Parvularculaceae bacterium]|nr:hypothetical protein [Parvularculaceae bacterium]